MDKIKKNKIIWIDDDINSFPLMPYIDELEDSDLFEIVGVANPDDIEKSLAENPDVKCIIVDISMPSGKSIPFQDAKGGMQTGLLVLKKLVDDTSLKDVKKVVFTIVNNSEAREYCKIQQPEIPYLEKCQFLTERFVTKMNEIINS